MLDMEMIRGSKPSCPILVYPTLAIHSFLEFFPLHSLLVKDCCFMLLASFCLYVKPFAVGNSKSRSPFIRCTRFGLLLLLVLYWFTRAGGIGQGRYSGDLVSFFLLPFLLLLPSLFVSLIAKKRHWLSIFSRL